MSSVCPFAKAAPVGAVCPMKNHGRHNKAGDEDKVDKTNDPGLAICPVKNHERHNKAGDEDKADNEINDPGLVSPKCPFGYDSHTFKLGPLSCMICQALLYQSSQCVPCTHKFCKACISRFKDCPLCGADIEKIEPDADLQATVDQFIDGHARIKRSQVNTNATDVKDEQTNVIYGDVSMERGAFLVQQAMRAFRAQNINSARSRLSICAEDIREQLETSGSTEELCSQLGAILGMLGDCCRAMGDTGPAVNYYEDSADFLSKISAKDLEVVHTLSVSLNKIGDLKYYDGDLKSARSYYMRSLDVRRNTVKEHLNASSQVIDLAVSLAKVADLDRNLGNEDEAINGFQEAIEHLESLKLNSTETTLQQRQNSVLGFLKSQLADKQEAAPGAHSSII